MSTRENETKPKPAKTTLTSFKEYKKRYFPKRFASDESLKISPWTLRDRIKATSERT